MRSLLLTIIFIAIPVIPLSNAKCGADDSDAGGSFFLRRRFELPLEPNAEAVEVAPTTSSWGPDPLLLQLGARVDDLTLPDAGGTEISLGDYLGHKNLIVTTYRAHW